MPSLKVKKLNYTIHSSSSYSNGFVAQNIMENRPKEQSSRWSSGMLGRGYEKGNELRGEERKTGKGGSERKAHDGHQVCWGGVRKREMGKREGKE